MGLGGFLWGNELQRERKLHLLFAEHGGAELLRPPHGARRCRTTLSWWSQSRSFKTGGAAGIGSALLSGEEVAGRDFDGKKTVGEECEWFTK